VDVAVIGGTGAEGFGVALRLAGAGHRVIIGSRSQEKGAQAAERAREILGGNARLEGAVNDAAATGAEVVFVTVPFGGQADIYRSLKASIAPGAVVVDATAPLATAVGGRPWQVLRPWHGSAAEQAEVLLQPGVRIVAALHTISAEPLHDLERPIESDVLVCGDDSDAKSLVGELIEQIPNLRWVDCGGLASARISETLTALLVAINRRYKIKDSGFRIVGRDAWGAPG
jgi:NADPH-dependent F420 reductase